MRWFILFVVFVLALPLGFACNQTPQLLLEPVSATALDGEVITGTLESDLFGTLGGNPLEPASFSFENGQFSVTGSNETVRVLFYAVTGDGCTGTTIGEYTFISGLNVTPRGDAIEVFEGQTTIFQTSTGQEWRWLLDGQLVSEDARYLFRPSYNLAGMHTLTLVVAGYTNHTWSVLVKNRNRAPTQLTEFIGITLPLDGDHGLNLSHYFVDPDNTELLYNAELMPAEGYIDSAGLNLTVEGEMVLLQALSPGKAFITYYATDQAGETIASDPIGYIVTNETLLGPLITYCGDSVCFINENCKSCPADCGLCSNQECTQQWDCTAWGECEFPGYEYRECFVVNDCGIASKGPAEVRECDYEARCDDGMMNGNETGVDCGGSCDPCPTCDDGIKNQGEAGVDCGGPCGPCPSCDDNILNQDESDIDCGGSCEPCLTGAFCNMVTDCISLKCRDSLCVDATCDDGIANQDEERVDCGGPCDPCPTCNDGILNQDEEDVDCGGQCMPCPTCDDGIANQDEEYIDCGGSCDECTWQDYIPLYKRIALIVAIVLCSLLIIYFLRAIVISRMTFLFKHGKAIHFFYEDGPTYKLIKFCNRLTRLFHRDSDKRELVAKAQRDIVQFRNMDERLLRDHMIDRLREVYARLLSLNNSFEFEILVLTIRRSKVPFTTKVILLRNTKLLYMIERTKLYTNAHFALNDVLRALEELEKAF